MTMKKILLSFLALGGLLFASSCQMDEPDAGTLTGEVDFTISAGIPGSITTYADGEPETAFSHLGGANNVDATQYDLRYILEVYDGDNLAYREVKYVDEGFADTKASFSARLLAKSYTFVLWADFVETKTDETQYTDLYYNTASLKEISYNTTNAADLTKDEIDAYTAKKVIDLSKSSKSESITLTRPFGKIRLLATDKDIANNDTETPVSVKLNFGSAKFPSSFNALTGDVTGKFAVNAVTTSSVKEDAQSVDGTTKYEGAYLLGYIYAFASTPQAAYPIDVTVHSDADATSQIGYRELTNIPVSANKLTTVIGNFYSNEGNIEVVVEDKFGDGEVIDAPEVISSTTLADAQAELDKIVQEAGDQEISYPVILNITAAAATAGPETFTLSERVKDITLVFSAGATNTVTITEKQGETFNGQVTIKNESDKAMSIVVYVPNGSAVLEGSYSNVTATTADNTLIIAENATVDKLSLKKGNVEVYGQLTALSGSKPSGSVITRHISTADAFIRYCQLLNGNTGTSIYGKVVLDADIDLANSAIVTSNVNNVEIDGQGHAISNYTVSTNTQSAGLFCDAVTVTVKNLILKNAKVTAINDGKGNAYAGALFGRTYGTIIVSNVKVIDPVIEGVNKVGGLVGFVAENHIEATDCSVDGGSITTSLVEGESGQIGGLIGYLGSLYESTCSISGCSVENTTINAYMTREDRTISKFIGCFQGNQASDILSIDNCHVTNVTLNALDDMAKAHFSLYGDMLGGQRYGNGTVNITNCDTDIIIYTKEQLAALAKNVNSGTGYSKYQFKLGADIDLNNETWTPIGTSDKAFQGNFDGNGHTISNLKAGTSSQNDVGLFGFTTNGTIKNIHIHNAQIKGYLDVGVVAGTPYTTKYSNIKVTGLIKVDGFSYVGGMFGKNVYANLTDLTIDADEGSYVKAYSVEGSTGTAYNTYVGGVIGFIGEGTHKLSNVESNINVIGSTAGVGGISGNIHYGNTFESCYCSGNVTLEKATYDGDQYWIGGIAGTWVDTQGTVTFTDCHFNGNLSSHFYDQDISAEIQETNKIVGARWSYGSSTSTGQLIIDGVVVSGGSAQ